MLVDHVAISDVIDQLMDIVQQVQFIDILLDVANWDWLDVSCVCGLRR